MIEKKLVVRGNSKVYKRILRLGHRTLDKPAKCDMVRIRRKKIDAEPNFEEDTYSEVKPISIEKVKKTVRELEEVKEETVQLGVCGSLTEREIVAVSSMKKNEVALFEFEEIEKEMSTKTRKLKERTYLLIEYIQGVTIIDVFINHQVYKVSIAKSDCHDRIDTCDQMRLELSLKNSNLEPIAEFTSSNLATIDQTIHLLSPPFSKIKDLNTFFTGMKDKEYSVFEFSPALYGLDNTNTSTETKILDTYDLPYPTRADKLYLFVKILENKAYMDVFLDKTVVKIQLEPGYTNSKPELLSKTYFDYSVSVNGKELLSTFRAAGKAPAQEDNAEYYEQHGFHGRYFAEYDLSRVLQKSLMVMKKFERARIVIEDPKHLKYGEDYEALLAHFRKTIDPEI